jgi:chromosome partitioning protein
MPVISFASSKGGVSKTTTAIAVGVDLALQGISVSMLDADPNAHLTFWAAKAAIPGLTCIPEVTEENVLHHIRTRGHVDDFVLVDLQGSANTIVTYAVSKSDLVIIPAQPSAMDLREVLRAAELIKRANDVIGREVAYRALLTKMHPLRSRVADHAREQLNKQEIPTFGTEVMERTAFREMTFHGKAPQMLDPASNASRNIRTLVEEIADVLATNRKASEQVA